MRTKSGQSRRNSASIHRIAVIVLCMLVCACGSSGQDKRDKGPPEAGFRIVHATSVALETELPGRVNALRTAEVRPQISGVILRRLFTEGAVVRQGQPLYQIDPSLYRAAAAQAQANLASAQAQAVAAQAKANRYKPLATEEAVAKQDYTDAAAAARAAIAAVQQNRAAFNTAQINLHYTTVPAPLTGRIGRSLVTEGALVTSNQTDPLAVISVLDPIYVDIQQSSGELLKLRRQLAAGGVAPLTERVRLRLDDGSDYGYAGSVEFSEVTVDPATGTVTLRASFPNPQGLLLPGMFVRASFAQAQVANAFLVPQAAVTRDAQGNAEVFLVGPGNKAIVRTITATKTKGNNWIITAGLKDGDRVITQGLGKLKSGQLVKPVPETASQQPRADGQKGDTQGKAG
jgi:membrane fusion protein (multidrug efflux system)